MSECFTYSLPTNFYSHLFQYIQQNSSKDVCYALSKCKYDFDDVGLAYYAGLKGDNWDKHAIDFSFEGSKKYIIILKKNIDLLHTSINKALKPSISGLLLRNIDFFENDLELFSISNKDRINIDLETSNKVLLDIFKIGNQLCLNSTYNFDSSENSMNDFFRDMFLMCDYEEVKDQTRHGLSSTGKDAGEVDILLTKNGKEIAIFEGLKLNNVDKKYISNHINKAIINYNSLGTATFIVCYTCTLDFENFCEKFFTFLQTYEYPLKTKSLLKKTAYPNASTRAAQLILSKDGYDFPVYFIAFKILNK